MEPDPNLSSPTELPLTMFPIKIKTMDNSIKEILVNPNWEVSELKSSIESVDILDSKPLQQSQ